MVFAIAALISAEEAVEEELIPIKQARKHSLVMTGARKYLFTRCIVNKPKYDRSKGASLSETVKVQTTQSLQRLPLWMRNDDGNGGEIVK